MAWTNYHSHTYYCDGTDAPTVYAEKALQLGMAAYGFSTHSPVPFMNLWSCKYERVAQYIEDVNQLKEAYQGKLDIYLSMEVDFVPNVTGPKDFFIENLGLDYTIGSVHFVDTFFDGRHWEIDNTTSVFEEGLNEIFEGDIQKAVTSYYDITRQMLREQCPSIVGHIDKIKMHNGKKPFFDESESWYRDEVMETLQLLATTGAIMEANTRGLYKKYSAETYPSAWIFKEAKQLGIPATINSDCHHPREMVAEFEPTAEMLQNCGYTELRVLLNGTWQDRPFNSNGIIL